MKQLRALVSDAELCAFLDGEASPERRAEIAGWLSQEPEPRAKLETWRRQERMLRASFGRIAQEPLPAWLTAPLEAPRVAVLTPQPDGAAPDAALRAAPPHEAGLWARLAVAVLAASAGAGVVAMSASQSGRGSLPEPVAASALLKPGHNVLRRAAEAHVAFSDKDALLDLKVADMAALAAFAARSGLEVRLPGAVSGLRPIGLRLTPGVTGLAGLVLYDTLRQGRLTLYVSRAGAGAPPGILLRERGGLTVASFSANGTDYALTGAAPRDQMVDWASAMRGALVQPRSLRGS